MPYLGIDIGGSSVKVAMLDSSLRTIGDGQSARYLRPDTTQLIGAIRAATSSIALPDSLDAIGLCVPGLIDIDRRVITLAVNVPGLVDQQLDELIARALPSASVRRLVLVNDAIATATDVVISRGLIGRSLIIAMGTGIGAAVLDRQGLSQAAVPLRVEGESSGHFGQIDVSLDDTAPPGPDGGAGSLEAYCGAGALRQKYPVAGDRTAIAFPQIQPADAACRALVRAVRIAHAIYRPHHIVLSGGVGIRLKHLVDPLQKLIDQKLTNVARKGWTFDVANDDLHAARGAARISGVTL